MKSWEPNKLVQDDQDVAYEPTDIEGKKLAAGLTLYLRRIMWRARNPPDSPAPWTPPGQMPYCRCFIRPISPDQ